MKGARVFHHELSVLSEHANDARVAARRQASAMPLYLVAIICVIALYGREFPRDTYGDFRIHLRYAMQMIETKSVVSPHFIFHLTVAGIAFLLPGINLLTIEIIAAYIFLTLTVIAILWLLRETTDTSIRTLSLLTVPATILLAVVGAASLFTYPRTLGYIRMNVVHNPTLIAARPFAIFLFGLVIRAMASNRKQLGRAIGLLALATVMSTLSKPSFIIAFAPALALFVGLKRISGDRIANWRALALGCLLPAVAALAWQYYFRYAHPTAADSAAGHIVFSSPMAVMRLYTQTPYRDLLLSIAFPLIFYSCFFATAKNDLPLNLAWLTFAISAIQATFFAESGSSFSHGNLMWGNQITLQIVFIASIAHLLRTQTMKRPLLAGICLVAFAIHVTSGLLYIYVSAKMMA